MAETPLQEQAAVVTGASQGIGRAVALRLAKMGAAVVLAARSEQPLRDLAAEIQQFGGRALPVVTDVRSEAAVSALFRAALGGFGRLDLWVNNAGMAYSAGPLHETTPEAWAVMMDTNLRAVFYSIRAVAPHFIQNRSGHIINIASLAAYNPVPGRAAYAAAKAGVVSLSASVAEELRVHGVRVSVVAPGSVDTDFSPPAAGGKNRARMLQPDDIAHAVAMIVTQSPQSFVSEILIRPTLKP